MKYRLLACIIVLFLLSACYQDYNQPQIVRVSGVEIFLHPNYILLLRHLIYSELDENEAEVVADAIDDIGKYIKYVISLSYIDEVDEFNKSGVSFYSRFYDEGDDKSAFLSRSNFIEVSESSISILMMFYKIEDDGSKHKFDVKLVLENKSNKWVPVVSEKIDIY